MNFTPELVCYSPYKMYTNNTFVRYFVDNTESFPPLSVKYDVKEGYFPSFLQRSFHEDLEITAFLLFDF
jgi:hypothetical protein